MFHIGFWINTLSKQLLLSIMNRINLNCHTVNWNKTVSIFLEKNVDGKQAGA
jgi:hypothetical protein